LNDEKPNALPRRHFLATLAALPAGAIAMSVKLPETTSNPDLLYPALRVRGDSYGEIGFQIGSKFGERIRAAIETRRAWVEKLEVFVAADPASRFDPFFRATTEEYPRLVEEMRGLGEGAKVDFRRLFTLALNPELAALMRARNPEKECTGVAVAAGDRLWIGHNEDGACDYLRSMCLLEIAWPSGLLSWCLCYPGYFPGNGPSANSAGLAQTVNFIAGTAVRPGVPRYVLDRAALEARSLDEAVAIATHPRRSYSQHHLFLSRNEGRIVSVETSPERHSTVEVAGIYAHANHFIHPAMRELKQIPVAVSSSAPRQQTADAWARSTPDPAAVSEADLLALLTSHQNFPLSICRHPAPGMTGCTLGAALFLGREGRIDFYHQQPCRGLRAELPWPAPAK
jgi:predicted choloylglycine hydrolase